MDIEPLGQRPEISVQELDAQRRAGAPHILLDVREDPELAVSAIDGALHIPMSEIQARLAELPDDLPVVVMCHHGMRSMAVARFLKAAGRTNIVNLAGGIDSWSQNIDSAVPRY